ncbi:winged helix-turn-helix domain-containing protein [Bacteroidota bacterium]
MLVENGHLEDFTVRQVMVKGLSWQNANQYLHALRCLGFATRKGHQWTVTDKGRDYYTKFMKEFKRASRGEFRWR